MGKTPLIRVRAAAAAEVCEHVDLNGRARALLGDYMGPREFVDTLMVNKEFVAGIDFLAHALPPREAIWWGCLCLQYAYRDRLLPVEKDAARAAVQWVLQPTEEYRAAAKAPAAAAGVANPAGELARAVNMTGGSLAPPQLPCVPPDLFAPARSAAMAIKLSCAQAEPLRIVDTQRLYLLLGIGIAEGNYLWSFAQGGA